VKEGQCKVRKIIRKIGLYLFILIVLLLGVGFVYQWVGSSYDYQSYRPVGKLYDVAGHKMHLYTEGQGETTVVFASGWGTANPYADFFPLYAKLSPYVKLAVYDRFGYGYSDTTGRKREIDGITDEIHELLRASGQKPPYVMVGHSLGSLETIRYAQRFPDEVKGIVLIEGGSPEYYASSKPFTYIPLMHRMLIKSGIVRLLYHMDGFAESIADQRNALKLLPDPLKKLDRTSTLLKAGNRDMTDEIRQSQRNAEVILKGKKPINIPMRVLTADHFGRLSEDKSWMNSEAALPSWSTSGQQIIVKDTSHYLHHYKPEIVVKEILHLAE
jgi:pimeloyl-ACP methyl ester carboxylesterase